MEETEEWMISDVQDVYQYVTAIVETEQSEWDRNRLAPGREPC